MSKTTNTRGGTAYRHRLLATVSAAALLSIVYSTSANAASDADRPVLWIEFGGQLERVGGTQEPLAPPFTQSFAADGLTPVEEIQRAPRYSNGAQAALTFAPLDSKWNFSVSFRYGRSNNSDAAHDQTNNPAKADVLVSIPILGLYLTNKLDPMSVRFGDTTARTDERHAIVDFQVGRDLGLGLLGGHSVVDMGVRFAQFTSKSIAQITANSGPDWQYKYQNTFYGFPADIKFPTESWDFYRARASMSRSFRGIGPSLAFNTSVPLAGDPQGMQIGVDLGVNGAILFGRQKTSGHEQILDDEPYIPHHYNFIPLVNIYHHTHDPDRSRSVAVPNLGGFVGISANYSNAKLSLGYRGDFFFGAIDGGIDTRHSVDRGFFGPFASLSIGMGD